MSDCESGLTGVGAGDSCGDVDLDPNGFDT